MMRWFEKYKIKNEDALSSEEIAYLKKPSLTALVPGNFFFRRHFDLLVMTIFFGITDKLLNVESAGYLTLFFIFLDFVMYLSVYYFFICHGRRLAWNRNQWQSVGDFKESEKKWTIAFGILSGFAFIIFLLLVLTSNLNEYELGALAVTTFVLAFPFLKQWGKRENQLEVVAESP